MYNLPSGDDNVAVDYDRRAKYAINATEDLVLAYNKLRLVDLSVFPNDEEVAALLEVYAAAFN